jgi:HEAT repeat protein
VRVIAQGALGDIGPAASNSVPALIDCVDHPLQPANRGPSASATTDINAIWALGRIGPSAASATSSLKKVLAAGEGREKVYSAEALWRIGWHNSNVLVSLQTTLTDSNRQARAEAAEALLNIGTNAECAVPALRSVLADSDARVRVNAARALVEIRPGDEKARDLLLETISPHSTSQYSLHIFAASSLLRYRPAPPDAVALLISALDGKDPAQQIQAAYTLSGAKVETPRVVLTLREILTSSNNPKIVVSAIKIAALVGPPAAELVSQLQRLAASGDLEIHKEASIALVHIQNSSDKE